MIEEFLNLRNKIHNGKFRLSLCRNLWEAHYMSEEELKGNNIITVMRNGTLMGFVIYSLSTYDKIKAYGILDLCVEGRNTLVKLIDKIIDKGVKDGVDFIFLRKCEEPDDDEFDRRGFLRLTESVIMTVLLDPRKLLLVLSEEISQGKILKLVIEGFDPITVKVGRKAIKVVRDEKPNLKVQTDSKTFLELFFGKTSVLKEFLKGKIRADKIYNLSIAFRFFHIIKQRRWYIPPGDWT